MESKIIEKVQNLLELAYDAPNDEEGQTALLMAQKLMVKHNLSMSDVTTARKIDKIGETVGTWEYRLPWWQEKLAAILGENFRCRRLGEDFVMMASLRLFSLGINRMLNFALEFMKERFYILNID